jgi:predicted XRE-type DNA-binding protein
MKKKMMVEQSSGNVFADLGLSNADEALAKAELARRIGVIIKKRGLSQVDAAKLLDVDQPKVSALTRGVLSGFSTGRLLRFLSLLNCDVNIVLKPSRRRRPGRITVMA